MLWNLSENQCIHTCMRLSHVLLFHADSLRLWPLLTFFDHSAFCVLVWFWDFWNFIGFIRVFRRAILKNYSILLGIFGLLNGLRLRYKISQRCPYTMAYRCQVFCLLLFYCWFKEGVSSKNIFNFIKLKIFMKCLGKEVPVSSSFSKWCFQIMIFHFIIIYYISLYSNGCSSNVAF